MSTDLTLEEIAPFFIVKNLAASLWKILLRQLTFTIRNSVLRQI